VVTGFINGTAVFGAGEVNETTLVSAGSNEMFVARYNADGTLAWAKRAGGASSAIGYAIASRADGSSVVTGDFYGTATFGAGEANETTLVSGGTYYNDTFVAGYNADGTLAWATRAGGSNNVESGRGIASYEDGSSVVTGYFWGTSVFGAGEVNETTLVSAGNTDIFVAKYYGPAPEPTPTPTPTSPPPTDTPTQIPTSTPTPTPTDAPPVLNPIGDKTIDEEQLLSFTVTANDADDSELSYSATGLPAGAEFDANSRVFSWIPAEEQGPGTYAGVTFTVSDGGKEDSETIHITVSEVNLPPVLDSIGNKTVNEMTELSFTIGAADPDVPENTLTFTASGLPAGASFTGHTFSWTPTASQPAIYSGIVFTVTDSGTPSLSDSEAITITVLDITPPVITLVGDSTMSLECSIDSYDEPGATASDTCCGDLTANIVIGGDVVDSATAGEYSVTYDVTDCNGLDAAQVTRTVTVGDTIAPEITCPADVILEYPADTSVEANGSATGSDTCGEVTITSSDEVTPGTGNTLVLARTWTATDEGYNSTSCVQTITVIEDGDGDGYYAQPYGDDCDDSNPDIHPGAEEVPCNGIDEDCDGSDSGGTDNDGDGYTIEGGDCGPVDCDDSDPTVCPGCEEIPCDGIDQNCNAYPVTVSFDDQLLVKPEKEKKHEKCRPCRSIHSLTIRYTGAEADTIAYAYDKRGNLLGSYPIIEGVFTATDIGYPETIFEVGSDRQTIHTSCSKPIGPGYVFGFFTIEDWDAVDPGTCNGYGESSFYTWDPETNKWVFYNEYIPDDLTLENNEIGLADFDDDGQDELVVKQKKWCTNNCDDINTWFYEWDGDSWILYEHSSNDGLPLRGRHEVAAGDVLDSDEIPELIVIREGFHKETSFYHWNAGTWELVESSSDSGMHLEGGNIAFGDYDKDGVNELIVKKKNKRSFKAYVWNTGTKKWDLEASYSRPDEPGDDVITGHSEIAMGNVRGTEEIMVDPDNAPDYDGDGIPGHPDVEPNDMCPDLCPETPGDIYLGCPSAITTSANIYDCYWGNVRGEEAREGQQVLIVCKECADNVLATQFPETPDWESLTSGIYSHKENELNAIAEECSVAACWTDDTGMCTVGLDENKEYIVFGPFETTQWVPNAKKVCYEECCGGRGKDRHKYCTTHCDITWTVTPEQFAYAVFKPVVSINNEFKDAHLDFIRIWDRLMPAVLAGTIVGSELNVIPSELMIDVPEGETPPDGYNATGEITKIYPIMFEADTTWEVEVDVAPPEGFEIESDTSIVVDEPEKVLTIGIGPSDGE
jgi:hypothetical protein